MKEDISRTSEALEQLIGGNFEEAYRILFIKSEGMYLSLGRGFLGFIRAMLTFELGEIDAAVGHLTEASELAEALHESTMEELYKDRSVYTRVYVHLFGDKSVAKGKRGNGSSGPGDETNAEEKAALNRIRCHCELVLAESTLLRAVLSLLTDLGGGGWMLLVREAVHLRRSYLGYHWFYEQLSSEKDDSDIANDADYRTGVLLGKGLFNLIFPLLPQSLLPVFALFGYEGSLEAGLDQLHEAASLARRGLRGSIAAMMLLMFYLIVANNPVVMVMATDDLDKTADRSSHHRSKSWLERAEELLSTLAVQFPQPHQSKSPILQYFKGRLHYRRGDLLGAIAAYTDPTIQWSLYYQACAWEVIQCYAERLEWKAALPWALRLAKESRWSRSFCSYLGAAILEATASDPKETNRYLADVQQYFCRRLGKTIPLEKFALFRANSVLEQGQTLFIPHYELLLIWDILGRCEGKDAIFADVAEKLESAGSDITPEQTGIAQLILATIERARGQQQAAAVRIEEKIIRPLERAKDLNYENTYILPMARCELTRCYLEVGDAKAAKPLFKVLEAESTKYLLEKAVRIRLSQMKLS
jgi:hypothetical protein